MIQPGPTKEEENLGVWEQPSLPLEGSRKIDRTVLSHKEMFTIIASLHSKSFQDSIVSGWKAAMNYFGPLDCRSARNMYHVIQVHSQSLPYGASEDRHR